MLDQSSAELASLLNIFKFYSHFQTNLENKEESVPISQHINAFYASDEVHTYLLKMNDLLQVMQQASIFNSTEKAKSSTQ